MDAFAETTEGKEVIHMDRCLCCGEPIPEGGQVCLQCAREIEDKRHEEQVESLRSAKYWQWLFRIHVKICKMHIDAANAELKRLEVYSARIDRIIAQNEEKCRKLEAKENEHDTGRQDL